jgi:hypothetical protein
MVVESDEEVEAFVLAELKRHPPGWVEKTIDAQWANRQVTPWTDRDRRFIKAAHEARSALRALDEAYHREQTNEAKLRVLLASMPTVTRLFQKLIKVVREAEEYRRSWVAEELATGVKRAKTGEDYPVAPYSGLTVPDYSVQWLYLFLQHRRWSGMTEAEAERRRGHSPQ